MGKIVQHAELFNVDMATDLGVEKLNPNLLNSS